MVVNTPCWVTLKGRTPINFLPVIPGINSSYSKWFPHAKAKQHYNLYSNRFIIWLVVLTILKNISQWEVRIIPYMKWKIKFMFETTNQS